MIDFKLILSSFQQYRVHFGLVVSWLSLQQTKQTTISGAFLEHYLLFYHQMGMCRGKGIHR